MPTRKLIKKYSGYRLLFLTGVFGTSRCQEFSPDTEFEKWVAIEVVKFGVDIEEFETFLLPGRLYAVFVHNGTPRDFQKTLKAIHFDWLPSSSYELDDRPHFEIMGEKYKNNHPDSEEEVWVPIKTSSSSNTNVKFDFRKSS